MMTNKQAWLYAAEWGSFMTNGDPGACMYGFDESFLVQSESHRAECLAWIAGCKADVKASPSTYESSDKAKLRQLGRKVRAARLQSDSNASKLDAFARAYVTAALWSTNDESDETGGAPLDDNYGIEDIAPETLASMIADCGAFQRDNATDLALAYRRAGYDPSSAGHDYWLTRNGHGAGFWDRGLGKVGDRLSDACRRQNVDLYVGDDGRIHL